MKKPKMEIQSELNVVEGPSIADMRAISNEEEKSGFVGHHGSSTRYTDDC